MYLGEQRAAGNTDSSRCREQLHSCQHLLPVLSFHVESTAIIRTWVSSVLPGALAAAHSRNKSATESGCRYISRPSAIHTVGACTCGVKRSFLEAYDLGKAAPG